MRQRLAALAAATTLLLTSAPAAHADGLWKCTAKATLTEGSTTLYNATQTYTSLYDLSTSYTKTFTYNGETYTYKLLVTCTH